MRIPSELNGYWEEPGVIGTRIEIRGSRILVLWRNSPVLDTRFTVERAEEGRLYLRLKSTGLRYEGADRDYATVTGLYLADGRLHFEKDFPITGKSEEILAKTDNSRYGNVTVVDKEILPELKGTWKDEHDFYTLTFQGNKLTVLDYTVKIHVVRGNGETGGYRIVNQDPSKREIPPFFTLEYLGDRIEGRPLILDAPPVTIVFHKL